MNALRTACVLLVCLIAAPRAQSPASRVVVVTIDGLRWQEMFTGADETYFKRDSKGVIDPVSAIYAGATPEARRAALMPFVWKTMATEGQIFGDPAAGSRAHVTNGLWFSYPGYNEMFSGKPDPRVDSNKKIHDYLAIIAGYAAQVRARVFRNRPSTAGGRGVAQRRRGARGRRCLRDRGRPWRPYER